MGDTLTVKIVADPTEATKGFKKVETDAERMARKLEDTKKRVRDGVGKAGALVAAGTALAIHSALDAAQESQKISRVTEQVVKSTGGAANLTADQVGNLANDLADLTGVDDELIQSSENVLLTFTNVRNELGKGNDVFSQAEGLALDLSTVMGGDLQGATVLLGKALNDPIKGLTALGRAGVSFTSDQKETIKALVKSGDLLSAQKIILGEVNREFGGSAAAAATDADRAKVAFGNLEEAVGGTFLPVMEAGSRVLTDVANGAASLPAPLQLGATALIGVGGAALYLAPKVKGAVEMLDELALTSPRTAQGLGLLGKAGLAAAVGLTSYSVTLKLLEDSVKFDGDVTQLTEDLTSLGKGVYGAKPALEEYSGGITGLADDIQYLNDKDATGVGGRVVDMFQGKSPFKALTGSDAKQAANNIDALDKALAEMVRTGNKEGADKAYLAITNALAKQGIKLEDVGGWFDDYADAAGHADKNSKGASGSIDLAGAAAAASEKPVKTLAEKWQEVADAADAAGGKLDTLYGITTSGIKGRIEANAALADFTAGLKDNGLVLNENTKAGQDNYTAAISARDAAVDYAKTLAANGDIKGAIKYTVDYGKVLASQAEAAGLSDEKTAALLETLGLTPEQVVLAFSESGYKETKQKAIDLTNHANAAAAKRFLNWVANSKDPIAKAEALERAADDAAGKRFLTWYSNTATEKQKVDLLRIAISQMPPHVPIQFDISAVVPSSVKLPVDLSLGKPGAASGTNYHRGGPILVGENGPEIANLPRGTSVTPAGQSANIMARTPAMAAVAAPAAPSLTVVFQGPVYGPQDIEAHVRTAANRWQKMTGQPWLERR